MSLPAPFGKYELLEQIGSGGMAEVFLARSFGVAGFEKRLVIKRIRPEHASDPRFVALFIHEAKIGVHLNHPNIVQVYELGKVGGSYYIAMEYLHGRDVNAISRLLRSQEGRLDVHLAVNIVAETCRGLAYAHGSHDPDNDRLGLVHRDISPHNLFVTFTGEVKIVDFGIARLSSTTTVSDDEIGPTPKRPGGGKYAYMSPEQAAGAAIDQRTDIFSLGVVLWELLFGRRLFRASDPVEKLVLVQEASLPSPESLGVEIDPGLERILHKALARDRDDRYDNASVFEEDLRAWLYDSRAHSGRSVIAAMMQQYYPGAARRNPADLDLAQLAADIERLDQQESTRDTTRPTASEIPPQNTIPTETPALPMLTTAADQRKPIAVLVIDVDGFTDLSLRAEPEVLFKRHLQMLRWLRGVIDAFGGTIQRAHDDQIYVFFGVPKTRSDDLRRALECAMDLQRRCPELHAKGLPLQFAIGVHAGDVTIGKVQKKLRYMSRGNTTRLARRISDLADHGQILASEVVFRATEGAFLFKRGPWLLSRGGRRPAPSYVFEGRAAGEMSPSRGTWLRRADELDLIRDALVGLGDRNGASLVVHGGSGTGKTRLVQEVMKAAGRRKLAVFEGRASAFGRPMKACRELIAAILGVPRDTAISDLGPHLDRLRQLGLFARQLDAIGFLMGTRQQPRFETDEVWRAVEYVLTGLAKDRPYLAVIEDIHGLPMREIEHLGRMVQRLADDQVLVILTCQGPVPAPLEDSPTITLGPLDTQLQQRLLRECLGVTSLSPDLLDLFERTCEGNPLYIEELTKFLKGERKVIVEGRSASLAPDAAVDLPGNLAGLIGARIDALDPASKGALQLAAVMGPSFSTQLLGDAIGMDDPVPLVNDLTRHGLVRRGTAGDQWTFSSEFVRQAALRGILGVQRRDYHRLIASAIERRAAGIEGERALSLSEHCGAGGRYLDAARYAYKGGQHLEDEQDLPEARDAYRRGLHWLTKAPETPETFDARVQGEAMLRLRQGVVQLLLGDSSGGTTSLQIALDITSDSGLPWLEIRAHLELGRHYLQAGPPTLAGAHLHQAELMAEHENDPSLQLEVLEAMAVLAHDQGRDGEAAALWRRALKRTDSDPKARARCLIGLANGHLRAGRLQEARPLLEQALEAARASADRILEGRVLNNIGLMHAWKEEADEAIRFFRLALQVREDIGYTRGVAVNHHNIGDVHFMRGDLPRAWVSFRRSRELAEEMGWRRGVALNDIYLGYIDGTQGTDRPGLDRIHAAASEARDLGDFEIAASGAWLAGRLLADRGQQDEARTWLEQGLAEATERGLGPIVQLIEVTLEGLSPAGSPD